MAASVRRPLGRLGQRIRDARNARHLTLAELGLAANVGMTYVHMIEQGKRKPSADVLRALARALLIDYAELAVLAGYQDAPPADGEAVIVAPEQAPLFRRWAQLPAETLARFDRMLGAWLEPEDLKYRAPFEAEREAEQQAGQEGSTGKGARTPAPEGVGC